MGLAGLMGLVVLVVLTCTSGVGADGSVLSCRSISAASSLSGSSSRASSTLFRAASGSSFHELLGRSEILLDGLGNGRTPQLLRLAVDPRGPVDRVEDLDDLDPAFGCGQRIGVLELVLCQEFEVALLDELGGLGQLGVGSEGGAEELPRGGEFTFGEGLLSLGKVLLCDSAAREELADDEATDQERHQRGAPEGRYLLDRGVEQPAAATPPIDRGSHRASARGIGMGIDSHSWIHGCRARVHRLHGRYHRRCRIRGGCRGHRM